MWLSEWSQLKLGGTKNPAISHTGHTRPRVTVAAPSARPFPSLPEAALDGPAPHARAAFVWASDPHVGRTVGRPSPSPNFSTTFSKTSSILSDFFFLNYEEYGWGKTTKKNEPHPTSASLETLNWFVGWLARFSTLISSNLNSAGGQITAYIKYTKILLLRCK